MSRTKQRDYPHEAVLTGRRRERMLRALKKAQSVLPKEALCSDQDPTRNRVLLANARYKLEMFRDTLNDADLPTRDLFCFENPPRGSEEHGKLMRFAMLMTKHHDRDWRMLPNLGKYSLEDIRRTFEAEGVEITDAFRLFHGFYQEEMARSEDKDLLPTDQVLL